MSLFSGLSTKFVNFPVTCTDSPVESFAVCEGVFKDTRYTRHVQNQGFEQVAATLTIGEHGHDFISDTVLLHVKNKAVSLKVANSVG